MSITLCKTSVRVLHFRIEIRLLTRHFNRKKSNIKHGFTSNQTVTGMWYDLFSCTIDDICTYFIVAFWLSTAQDFLPTYQKARLYTDFSFQTYGCLVIMFNCPQILSSSDSNLLLYVKFNLRTKRTLSALDLIKF